MYISWLPLVKIDNKYTDLICRRNGSNKAIHNDILQL